MLDPLVGAVLNPQEIWQMTDDMLVAQEKWLPQYAGEIEEAKKRQEKREEGRPRRPSRAWRESRCAAHRRSVACTRKLGE